MRLEDHPTMLGTWPLSGPFMNRGRQMGWGDIAEADAVHTIAHAYAKGIRWFDTSDAYGLGRTNGLIACALSDRARDSYGICLKLGYVAPLGRRPFERDVFLSNLEKSLAELHTSYVDLFSFQHLYFGDDNCDLDAMLQTVERLRAQNVLRQVSYRFAHRYTLGPEVAAARTNDALDALADFGCKVVHSKMNLLCSLRHCEAVLGHTQDRHLVINKPFAQGVLWGILEMQQREFTKADHRYYRAEFSRISLGIMKDRLGVTLYEQSTPFSALERLAYAFLLDLPLSKTITFGAKSASQVDHFVQLANAIASPIDNDSRGLIAKLRRGILYG